MIKYVSYFDIERKERKISLAAVNKMDYLINIISELEYKLEIISASGSITNKNYKCEKIKINTNTNLKLFASLGKENKIKSFLDYIYLKIQLIIYLALTLKRDDKVIVYHSLSYMRIIKFLKKIKKFYLIIEVEEIYTDVIKSNIKEKLMEIKYFNIADAYIFPTILLNEKINKKNKPYTIIHGTYKVEKQKKFKFLDDKIHCIYAGTFDSRKGGAAAAAAAAEFLDEKYHIHILGFGSINEIEKMKKIINEISLKTKCELTYDGLKSGDKYIEFMQACHIGLSTQNPNAKFNDTSFPSKILSYMANGLRVVTIKIKAIETSNIKDSVYYYEKQTPEEIANAIKKIDFNDGYDGKKTINYLNKEFSKEFKKLLKI